MKKKIIAKISEGLGNQLFMYANAYAISKKFNLHLNLDPYSGFYQHNLRSYLLDNFNISSDIASPDWIFANNYKNKKSFLFEFKNNDKSTYYKPLDLQNANDIFYIDGNFESEKYFLNYRNELLDEFSLKNKSKYINNKFLDIINTENVVSISIRQNRYSERIKNKNNLESIQKSEQFVKETVDYIYKSIEFVKTKIINPKFLLWSNDFNNLQKYFPKNEFYYVENTNNKILNDFYLMTQCKNFIVGPSTFSWWGAWLSNKNDKICIRPKYLNPSNNKDFWPQDWISI